MGIGPWAQGDLIRDTQRAERARWRRAIKRARIEMRAERRVGHAMEVFEQALDRMELKITPRKPKSKFKAMKGRLHDKLANADISPGRALE
jgi:hypothetical protein